MNRIARFAFALVIPLFAIGSTRGDSVVIGAAKDNTLYEEPDGALSNSAGDFVFAGTEQGSLKRRAVLAFDIANAVPAGAAIDAVQLTLNMSRTISSSHDTSLHRLTSDWGEGSSTAIGGGGGEGIGGPSAEDDATWIHTFFPDDLWTSPGGDFLSTPSDTISVGALDLYTWGSTPAMVDDVQSWLDDPDSNYGWILIGNESTSATAKRYDSRTNSTGIAPQLAIEFTVIPEPSTGALLVLGLVCFRSFCRRRA